MVKQLTLGMIIKENKILLGMKKRGFGVGKWNGFGGKKLENETIENCLIREIEEECSIRISSYKKSGIITFKDEKFPEDLEVHIFRINEFQGNPKETEEMIPKWFDIDSIPYKEMWIDDSYWLPLVIENKKFKGEIVFDNPSAIKSSTIAETKDI